MAKIRLRGVRKKGDRVRLSDFALGVVITPAGDVYFDRVSLVDGKETGRSVVIGATNAGARKLGQWLLDNVPE